TAAQAPAMVGAIGRGLVAARDRLPVVIAEAACHAGGKLGVVQRAKETIEPAFEGAIHAADHVVLHRHASFLRGLRILPREVLIHELGNSLRDGPALALVLDRDLDRIDLARAFVHQPEISVDAVVSREALVRSFERAHIYVWLGERNFYSRISGGAPCVRLGVLGA